MSDLQRLGAQPRRPLAPLTSLKVGGPADWLFVAASPEAAVEAMRAAAADGVPASFLGGGSNLLVSDRGVEGLAIKPTFSAVRLEGDGTDEVTLCAEAGQPFPALARRLARQGWSGLEWAVSVPGTVGGAVVNNAGAFGGSTEDTLLWVDTLDARGVEHRFERADLGYAYRHSRLKSGDLAGLLVVAAGFRVRRADPTALRARVQAFQDQRTLTQPRQQSAGSVFANPPGDYAGRLIEAAGLKGATRGRAQISPQHANFIVNLGGARAADVYALIQVAQCEVWARSGVWLRPEVQLRGRWLAEEIATLEGPLDR